MRAYLCSIAFLLVLGLGLGTPTSAVPVATSNESDINIGSAQLDPRLYPADQIAARQLELAAGGSALGNLVFTHRGILDEPRPESQARPHRPEPTKQEDDAVARAVEAALSSPDSETESQLLPRDDLADEPATKRVVFSPTITYPRQDTVWRAGDVVHVRWRTEDIPESYRSHLGTIMLGFKPESGEGGLNLRQTLASHFRITQGHAAFTLPPTLPTRNDYIVVLFGDSGNASPLFTIRGRQDVLQQHLEGGSDGGASLDDELDDGKVEEGPNDPLLLLPGPLMYKDKSGTSSSEAASAVQGVEAEGEALKDLLEGMV